MQVVSLLYEARHFGVFLGHLLRHEELVLHVVVVLLVSAQLLHVFRIIGVVVYRGHRAELVEAHREHSLGIHVRESERSHHVGHALAPAVLLHGIEQCARHIDVVHEVNPPEAHVVPAPGLVCLVVDDGSHAPHHLSALLVESHIVFRLAEIKCGVLVLAQRVHIVAEEVRRVVFAAFIQVVTEIDELLQFLFRLYLSYFY